MDTETNFNLCENFKKGLKELGLTFDEVKTKWKYCGGDTSDRSYFMLYHKNKELPKIEKKYHCICGTKIIRQYYITDGKGRYLVIGSTCKENFIDNSGRNCDKCGERHRNRLINRCNFCKNLFCDNCGNKKSKNYYKMCYKCYRQEKKDDEERTKKYMEEQKRKQQQPVTYDDSDDEKSFGKFYWWK